MVALAEAMPLEQNADLREFFLQMLRIAEDARAKADSGCETLKNVQKDIERVLCFTIPSVRLALMVNSSLQTSTWSSTNPNPLKKVSRNFRREDAL